VPKPSTATGSAELLRQLGIGSATALVVSNMVGTGIFTTSGFLAGQLGDPKLVLGIWVVGAAFALAGAFCYSELGVNFPSSGGEYVYMTRAYGPTWGFVSGWVSFFAGFSAPIAAAALAFSDYLGHFFPVLKQENAPYTLGSGAFAVKLGGAQIAASLLVAVFTILNCFGVRRAARVQNVLTSLKVTVIIGFIVAGFLFGAGDVEHFSMPAVRSSATPLLAQFAISLFWIYVSYSGWNAATYVAEELKKPERTLPLALACGTALVATLYVGLNLMFIYAAPLEEMKGVIAVGAVFSALEVVPLTLIGLEALQTWRRSRGVAWLGAYRWVILSFVAVGFWNTVGAGLLGFAINPPASLYYVQGLNMTAAHGHAALFGVYGMLGIGLMLFCLRGLFDRALHADAWLKPAFWGLNVGLAMMVFLSLLPAGIYQAHASITRGLWYARSPEVIHSTVMETLVWLRVPGDVVFAAGAACLAVYALKLLRRRADARAVAGAVPASAGR